MEITTKKLIKKRWKKGERNVYRVGVTDRKQTIRCRYKLIILAVNRLNISNEKKYFRLD